MANTVTEQDNLYRATRRKARECALQVLYQLDISEQEAEQEVLDEFWQRVMNENKDDLEGVRHNQMQRFAERLIHGVLKEKNTLDERLNACASNWRLDRMNVIDRNIMRLSAYEILFCEDVPQVAAMNEGIELAKLFGDKESSRFINGVLDKLRSEK